MQTGRSKHSWILAIDQGGHASRALIMDQQARIHAQASVPISARPVSDGLASAHIEYEPEEMLTSLRQAIEQATESIDCRQIMAAGLATQRSNIICWDRHSGQSLSPIISWQDRRAHQWLMTKQAHSGDVHALTGLFLSAHYGASKLNWCLNNIDAVRRAHNNGSLAWGPMSSWLIYRLCREQTLACDAVNASRTLLWSLEQCDWSAELLKLFELPADGLPQCVANNHEFGTLEVNGHDIPLRLVTGDQAAALYAFGEPRSDNAYITVGTGAFVLNPGDRDAIIDDQLLSSIVNLDDHGPRFVTEGTVNGAGSALDYYAEHFNRPDYLDRLPVWLERSDDPPLFLNGYSGLGTPFMQADFPCRFIGDGDEINRLVAVIESIVFLLSCNLERMRVINPSIRNIVIGGGLARLDGFCQRLADLGLPVRRPAQVETTCQGLAWLLFQHLDEDAGRDIADQCRASLHTGSTFVPRENLQLGQRYQRWRQLMEDELQHGR